MCYLISLDIVFACAERSGILLTLSAGGQMVLQAGKTF